MLTAETITDEQIRQLQADAYQADNLGLVIVCRAARGITCNMPRDEARAHCAEILNARNAKQ